jgi:hypothetical protein
MKYILLFILSSSAFADINLDDAYKREKTYLMAQKDSLLKMKASLKSLQEQRKAKAKKDIQVKQKELSSLMLKNQELHEEFKSIEKSTKESSQMVGQLEKNALKISENLSHLRAKLGLTSEQSTELDPVKRFEEILSDAFFLIKNVSSEDWRPHAFLDENDHLIQGEVLFQGLFSAWGKRGNKLFSLVPYNNEFLKVASIAVQGETYLFSPNFERTGLKASKSWKESVADAIPGLVMIMIMIAVLGLFIMLARS